MNKLANKLLAFASITLMSGFAMADCETTVVGTDNLSYSKNEIVIPSNCSSFTIKLVNKAKDKATKYNVVIAKAENVESIAKNGMYAGEKYGFLKKPDNSIIANSSLIGPGESTSVTFNVADIGPSTVYFSSFPGQKNTVRGVFLIK